MRATRERWLSRESAGLRPEEEATPVASVGRRACCVRADPCAGPEHHQNLSLNNPANAQLLSLETSTIIEDITSQDLLGASILESSRTFVGRLLHTAHFNMAGDNPRKRKAPADNHGFNRVRLLV